jgi:hypothetical protein
MLAWVLSMKWKELHPVIPLSKTIYDKGISLTRKALEQVEMRLERNL